MDLQDTRSFQPLGSADLAVRVWALGVPPFERAVWSVFDEGEREEAIRRVEALISFEESGDGAARAETANLSRPRFFSLLRAWRDSGRSLSAVIPQALGRGVRWGGSDADADDGLRYRVDEVLRSHGDWSKARMVRLILETSNGAAWSAGRVTRVVGDRLARMERDDLGGSMGLGRKVLIDWSPMTVRARSGERAFTAAATIVADIATTYILGFATGMAATSLVAEAAADAASRCASLRMAVAARHDPTFVALPVGDAIDVLTQVGGLQTALGDRVEIDVGRRDRPAGARLLEMFGPALGYLDFRPQAAISPLTTGEVDRLATTREPAPDEVVGAFLSHAVERRNAFLKPALSAGVSLERLVADFGAIASATSR